MTNSILKNFQKREARIFISSTFRDMMKEREVLVKKIFPELRKKFNDRAVTITEVDLRWGVLEEEAQSGKVIDICLTEIDKSRPYFIGLLGERYGWVPPPNEYEKHKKIIENFSWVKDDIDSGLSITEMEIQYGVLRSEMMRKRAFFYLRNSENEDSKKYTENHDSVEREKLYKLKDIILNTEEIKSDSYLSSDELAEKVFNDLSLLIEKDFPPISEEYSELIPQLNYIFNKTSVFIRNDKHFSKIDEHINRTSSPIVLTGKNGAGKSSLAANYLYEYSIKNPESILLYNFSGASQDSTNHISTLKRFCEILSGNKIKLDEQFPSDTENGVKNYLIELIGSKSPQKVLILIDGLDEYDNENESLLLNWLPDAFPENAAVIYSLGGGKGFDRLKAKRYETVYITEPVEIDKRELITNYLAKFSKKLPDEAIQKIIHDDISELPLTLKTMLDELRQFGVHEELDNVIEYYTKASGPIEFYEKVLERLEKDFEDGKKGIVSEILTALYLVKSGLKENELLEILDIPAMYWSPIHNSIESNFLNINGFIRFSNPYIKEAIIKRYLTDKSFVKSICNKIIKRFDIPNADDRMIEETAEQYINSENKTGLFNHLSNLFNMMALYDDSPIKLIRFWRYLKSDYSIEDAYSIEKVMAFIEKRQFSFNEAAAIFNLVGMLYDGFGDLKIAGVFYENVYFAVSEHLEENNPFLRGIIARLTLLYNELYDYENADLYSQKGIELAQKYLEKTDSNYRAAFVNRALVLSSMGNYNEAVQIFESLLEETKNNTTDEARNTLLNLSTLYCKTNEFDKAIDSAQKCLDITVEKFGKEHTKNIDILNNLGHICTQTGFISKGIKYYEECLEFAESSYGFNHPTTISYAINLTTAYLDEGSFKNSEKLLGRIEDCLSSKEITDDLIGKYYNAKAIYYSSMRNYNDAVNAQKRALNYFEKNSNRYHENTITAKKNIIQYLINAAKLDEAELRANELLDLLLEKYSEDDVELTEVYNLLGGINRIRKNPDKAYEYIDKALEIRRSKLGDAHPDSIRNAHNLAVLLIEYEQFEDAKQFIDSILEVIENNLGIDSPQYYETLDAKNEILLKEEQWKELEGNLASAYEYYKSRTGNSILTYTYFVRLISAKDSLGYKDQVLHLLPQAMKLCDELYGKESDNYFALLQDSAFIYSKHKMYDDSLSCYNKLLQLQTKLGNTTNINDTLNNIASIYFLNGEVDKARVKYEELFRKILPDQPELIDYWANYAKLEHECGNIDNAHDLYNQALSKSVELYSIANKKSFTHLYNLQRFLIQTKQFNGAEELLNKYYNIIQNDNPEAEEFQYEILDMLTNLYIHTKNYVQLEKYLNEKYILGVKLYGNDSVQLFGTLVNLATVYNVTFNDKAAVEVLNMIARTIKPEIAAKADKVYYDTYLKVVDCYKNNQIETTTDDNDYAQFIKENRQKADEAINQNDFITAVKHLDINLELFVKNKGDSHPETVLCKRDIAEIMMWASSYEEALNLLLSIIEIFQNQIGETHHEYQKTIYLIAKCHFQLKRYEEALHIFKEVLYQVESVLDSDHPFLYDVKRNVAETMFFMFKSTSEAIQIYNELQKANSRKETPDEIEEVHFNIRLGELYLRNGDYAKALEYLNQVEIMNKKLYEGQPNPYTIMILELKAFIMWKQKKIDIGEKFYLKALNNAKEIMPYGHPSQIKILKTLSKFYFDENRFSDALQLNYEIFDIYIKLLPENHPDIIEQKLVIALNLNNLHEHDKVVEILNEVLRITDVKISDYAKKILTNLYTFYKSE